MAVCDGCVANAVFDQTMSISDGPIYGLKPLRVCNWAAPQYGDTGVSAENTWKQAALVAVATLNTIAQFLIAQKRFNIAKEYADIAEDRWKRFKNDYMPFENQMVYESRITPEYVPQYLKVVAQYADYATSAFNKGQSHLAKIKKKYGLCFGTSLSDDLNTAQAIIRNDGVSFAFRDEENYALDMSDLRWGRRSAMGNVGRDNLAISANYAQAANTALAELGNLASEGASGAAYALGYIGERREIASNATFTLSQTYDTSSTSLIDIG